MTQPRVDYIRVHEPVYQEIAAGKRAGWSTADEIDAMMTHIRSALAATNRRDSGRLLDAGCGDGQLAVRIALETGFTVFGIDIVPLAIELAVKRASSCGTEASFTVGSVVQMPYPSAYFDCIVDAHCLHCVVLDDRAKYVSELKRILAPDGLIIVFSMVGDPPADMLPFLDPVTRCVIKNGIAGRHFGTAESIAAEFRAAGFSILDSLVEKAKDAHDNDGLTLLATH